MFTLTEEQILEVIDKVIKSYSSSALYNDYLPLPIMYDNDYYTLEDEEGNLITINAKVVGASAEFHEVYELGIDIVDNDINELTIWERDGWDNPHNLWYWIHDITQVLEENDERNSS